MGKEPKQRESDYKDIMEYPK